MQANQNQKKSTKKIEEFETYLSRKFKQGGGSKKSKIQSAQKNKENHNPYQQNIIDKDQT